MHRFSPFRYPSRPSSNGLAKEHTDGLPAKITGCPELWCLHLYRWTGALRVGGQTLPVFPGYVSIVAPNTPLSHFFRTSDPPAVHLSCGFRLATGSPASVLLPAMGDTGAFFGGINAEWEKAIGVFGASPRRAEALIWEILWRLGEGKVSTDTNASSYSDTGKRNRYPRP